MGGLRTSANTKGASKKQVMAARKLKSNRHLAAKIIARYSSIRDKKSEQHTWVD